MAGKASAKGRRQAAKPNAKDSKIAGTHLQAYDSQGSSKGFDKKAEPSNPQDMSSLASGGADSPSEPSTPKSLSASTRKKKNRKERERAAKGGSTTSSPRVSIGDLSDSVPSPPLKGQRGGQEEQLLSAAQDATSVNVRHEMAETIQNVLLSSSSPPPAHGTSATDLEDMDNVGANGMALAARRDEVPKTEGKVEDVTLGKIAGPDTPVASPAGKVGLVVQIDTPALDIKDMNTDQPGSSADLKLQHKIEVGNPATNVHSQDSAPCDAENPLQDPSCKKDPATSKKILSPLPMNVVAKEKLCGVGGNNVLVSHVALPRSPDDTTSRVLASGTFLEEGVKVTSIGNVDVEEVEAQLSSIHSNGCLNNEPRTSQDSPENEVGEGEGTEGVCVSSVPVVKRSLPHEDRLPCLPCGMFLEWFQAWFGPRGRSREV